MDANVYSHIQPGSLRERLSIELQTLIRLLADEQFDAGEDLTWPAEMLIRHSVPGMVFPRLKELNATAAGKLRSTHLRLLARNTCLDHELHQLLEQFARHNLKPILIKGSALHQQCYPAGDLRRYDDFDFILSKEDCLQAKEILLASGLRQQVSLTAAECKDSLQQGWELVFQQDEPHPYSIDISTSCCPRYFMPIAKQQQLCKRTESVRIDDRDVLTLAAEEHLLLLCIHGAKHGWSRLIWILDIHRLLTACTIDRGHVSMLAHELNCRRMLNLGLALSLGLFKTRQAGELLQPSHPPGDNIIGQVLRLLNGEERMTGMSEQRLHLSLYDHTLQQVRYLFIKYAAPGYSDWKAVQLPRWLRWGYYPVRWVRLAARAIGFRRNSR